jgi:hypothetical protein
VCKWGWLSILALLKGTPLVCHDLVYSLIAKGKHVAGMSGGRSTVDLLANRFHIRLMLVLLRCEWRWFINPILVVCYLDKHQLNRIGGRIQKLEKKF